jgi:hypothetical protein
MFSDKLIEKSIQNPIRAIGGSTKTRHPARRSTEATSGLRSATRTAHLPPFPRLLNRFKLPAVNPFQSTLKCGMKTVGKIFKPPK